MAEEQLSARLVAEEEHGGVEVEGRGGQARPGWGCGISLATAYRGKKKRGKRRRF